MIELENVTTGQILLSSTGQDNDDNCVIRTQFAWSGALVCSFINGGDISVGDVIRGNFFANNFTASSTDCDITFNNSYSFIGNGYTVTQADVDCCF